ncbi:MAG TPA: ATP-dependent 6-phosphofructokinase [Fimbriimonas sp.]
MQSKSGRIGILTGGGDCAGLNAVIAAAVKHGTQLGYEFLGFEKGWEGILDPPMYRELTFDAVRGISHLGGTILHTTNKGRFGAKKGAGDKLAIPEDILLQAKKNLAALGVEGLIVIGGDGSLSGALQLADKGVRIIGVPKTIDNDLEATDMTFGFQTAVQVAVDSLDRIHTTASSHDRVMFVEVMGRNAGWIALEAGLAGGADAILLPEFPFELERLVEFLNHRTQYQNASSALVVVAEGATVGGKHVTDAIAAGYEQHYGGISQQIMAVVESLAPSRFEMRNTVLGHMQRGGSPNANDRNLAKAYGVGAVDAYHRGEDRVMVSFTGGRLGTVPIEKAVARLKLVSDDSVWVKTARALGVFIN